MEFLNKILGDVEISSITDIIAMIFDMIKKAVLELFDAETGYTTEAEVEGE